MDFPKICGNKQINTDIWERNGRSAGCPVWHSTLCSCPAGPQLLRQGTHNAVAQLLCPQSGCAQLPGTCQTVSTGTRPHNEMLDHPRDGLAENRRKGGLFPEGASCGSCVIPPGRFSRSGRAQDTGMGTQAQLWQRWSGTPCSERGGRVQEHRVNLWVSHCYSTTTREHGGRH